MAGRFTRLLAVLYTGRESFKMKRRLLLIGLAVALPVGVGWWAKAAASWRPVFVGRVAPQNEWVLLIASERRAASAYFSDAGTHHWSANGDQTTRCQLFDEQSGRAKAVEFPQQRAVRFEGDTLWSFYLDSFHNSAFIEIEGRKQSFRFALSDWAALWPVSVRILRDENRVVCLYNDHIYRWNLQTGHLERTTQIQPFSTAVLSRDARTFVGATVRGIAIGDARNGKIQKRVAFQGFRPFESLYLSPYGHYALCEVTTNTRTMTVVPTATGRATLSFPAPNGGDADWAISDDEGTIFVWRGAVWEVRDLKTGRVRRRLPLVPTTSIAASSPDGATLYSIAKGLLYRQRAR